jgi:hypothetical protein
MPADPSKAASAPAGIGTAVAFSASPVSGDTLGTVGTIDGDG